MLKIIALAIGFFASLATFGFAVLEILRNHFRVDTHAMLLRLGDTVGGFLAEFQVAFSNIMMSVAQLLGGGTMTAQLATVLIGALAGMLTAHFYRLSERSI